MIRERQATTYVRYYADASAKLDTSRTCFGSLIASRMIIAQKRDDIVMSDITAGAAYQQEPLLRSFLISLLA